MPEDRFGDLGGERRSAAERFEEEDRLRPEPDTPPRRPEVPRPPHRYAWVLAIVALMGVGVVLIATTGPDTDQGLKGPLRGKVVPDFAAPLATGDIEKGVANVRGSRNSSKAAGPIPACQVRSEEVVNVCELRKKPLVLTFVVTDGVDCEPQVDRVERMRREFPQVNFAAVVSGKDRPEVEQVVRRRGWRLPVAVDEDLQVLKLYGVALCPTTVFARAGGRVRKTVLGNLTERQLRAQVRRLLTG